MELVHQLAGEIVKILQKLVGLDRQRAAGGLPLRRIFNVCVNGFLRQTGLMSDQMREAVLLQPIDVALQIERRSEFRVEASKMVCGELGPQIIDAVVCDFSSLHNIAERRSCEEEVLYFSQCGRVDQIRDEVYGGECGHEEDEPAGGVLEALVADLLRLLQQLQKPLYYFAQRVVFLLRRTRNAAVAVVIENVLRVLLLQTALTLALGHIKIQLIAQVLAKAADVVGGVFQEVGGLAALDCPGLHHLQHPEAEAAHAVASRCELDEVFLEAALPQLVVEVLLGFQSALVAAVLVHCLDAVVRCLDAVVRCLDAVVHRLEVVLHFSLHSLHAHKHPSIGLTLLKVLKAEILGLGLNQQVQRHASGGLPKDPEKLAARAFDPALRVNHKIVVVVEFEDVSNEMESGFLHIDF